MVTVDDYGTIRRAHRDGMSIRQIARQFGHSRRVVRHALTHAEPHPEPLTRDRLAPRLGPLHPVIDQILADDESARASSAIRRHKSAVGSETNTTTAAAMLKSSVMCANTARGIKRRSFR